MAWLIHSTGAWKEHKYVRIENGRYVYPEDLEGGSANGSSSSVSTENTTSSSGYDRDAIRANKYATSTESNRSAARLNETGKEIWSYVKAQISERKKTDTAEKKEERDSAMERSREKAAQTRVEITEELKSLSEALSKSTTESKKTNTEQVQAKNEQIESQRNARIAALQNTTMPEGLTRYEQRKWYADRDEEIARIRGEAKSEKTQNTADANAANTKLTEEAKATREGYTQSAASKREACANELKTALSDARETYRAAIDALNAKYEQESQQEYDDILSEYPKLSKSKKTKNSTIPTSSRKTKSSLIPKLLETYDKKHKS